MKKQHKVISFILVLSLLFSSMMFTVEASTVDELLESIKNAEFASDPTADIKLATSADSTAIATAVKGNFTSTGIDNNSISSMIGYGELDLYLVNGKEEGNTNEYVMIVPSATTIANKKAVNNAFIATGLQHTMTYSDPGSASYTPTYYVFDYDIATESSLLPLSVGVNTRKVEGNVASGGNNFMPSKLDICLNMTPGVFHHLTLVCDVNRNLMYVYLNNALITTVATGVMTDTLYKEFKNNGEQIRIAGSRIQINALTSSQIVSNIDSGKSPSFDQLSMCLDNVSERIISGTDLANYAGKGSLDGWSGDLTEQSCKGYELPSLIEINGVKYNNSIAAEDALDTIKLGVKAKMLRSCYSGSITVNCDAAITIPIGIEAKLAAGADVNLIKDTGSLWLAVLKNFKYSAQVISDNETYITDYISYPAADNLIWNIAQTNAVNERTFTENEFENLVNILDITEAELEAFTKLFTQGEKDGETTYTIASATINNSANKNFIQRFRDKSIYSSITRTDGGNEYLIIRDGSGATGDFPLNVHYQVNANTDLILNNTGYFSNAETYQLKGHDFVVFEQDIYSESVFINIYNMFNLRTPDNKPLSATQVTAEKVAVTPEKWYHVTYVGEVASGDSYLFLDGKCVAKTVGGLYDETAIARMNEYCQRAELDAETFDPVANMVLASFRTMQIAGEHPSGKNLTPDMSAASDNFYLRWADSDSTMSALIESINEDYDADKKIDGAYAISNWSKNIYNEYYINNILPERAAIATIDGVEYYDTTNINEALQDADFTAPLKEVVLYREYIGTIHVNCRATLTLNGIGSNVTYGDDVTKVDGTTVKVYKQTDTAVACIDGTLYYTAEDVHDVLSKERKEPYYVTFLSEPASDITIVANAVVDNNGLALAKVTFGNADCVVAEGVELSTVINLKETTVVATMNGVNYYEDQLAELQAAITAAKTVDVSFYTVPATPLKITCEATINTNTLIKDEVTYKDIFTTDISRYSVEETAASRSFKILNFTKTGTVEIKLVNANGNELEKYSVNATYGTDIVELLTEKGYMDGVFVSDGNTLNVTSWDVEPAGVVEQDTHTFTAKVTNSYQKQGSFAYLVQGSTTPVWTSSESDLISWIGKNETATVVLFDDVTFTAKVVLNGSKSIYLNGHTMNSTMTTHAMENSGTAKRINFYGDGTINYVTTTSTQALLFTGYDLTAKFSFNGVTINSTGYILQARSGNFEFNDCVINVHTYEASSAFFIGEDYNNNNTDTPMSLNLLDCDITFRCYKNNKNNALINSKVVLTKPETGYDRTIVIDGSKITTQYALVRTENGPDLSIMKLYVNNSDIMAKQLVAGEIKANSIFFVDDVRTNLTDRTNITFHANLISAKTSDGFFGVLYTSHDFAMITWSNGVTEYWASGSTPTNRGCLFDGVTAGGVGAGQNNTSYDSTGKSFPFGMFMNLTLQGSISFNLYVPTAYANATRVYLDGQEVQPNTYEGTDTPRTTVVAAAKSECYDYSITLAPWEAARDFTIVLVYGNQYVSRTASVAHYARTLVGTDGTGGNEKNRALLAATLAYIEEATKFSGNTFDMTEIKSLRSKLVMQTVTPAAPTLPSVTHTETLVDPTKFFESAQINIKGNSAFRFKLASGVNADGFKFYVANDKNDGYEERAAAVISDNGNIYLELSLRAYEMARSIKIAKGNEYFLYSLYDMRGKVNELANPATVIGSTYEYKSTLTLIDVIYSYASICDKYLDKNAAEYNQ